MRRRDFIILLGGAAAPSGLWSLPLRAQTAIAVRRVGLLSTLIETTDETRRLSAVLTAGLNELGLTDGRNIHLEGRSWGATMTGCDPMRANWRATAAEVILAIAARRSPRSSRRRRPFRSYSWRCPIRWPGNVVNSLSRPGGDIHRLGEAQSVLRAGNGSNS